MVKVKKRIFQIIQPNKGNDVASAAFDWFILALIVINVVLSILDTFSFVTSGVRQVLHGIETFSIMVFTVEYFLRLWTANYLYPDIPPWRARLKYAFSFMAIVDLLAILPFYLPFVFPIDLRVLRLLRLLRLFRLLKVNRYTNALSSLGHVSKKKANQLVSALFVVMLLLVIAALLMYNIESAAQPNVFENAFSGFWWAIATLTTVGYGDIYPVTAVGKILSAIIALLGIGVVAIPTGIISAGFMENIESEGAEPQSTNEAFVQKYMSLSDAQQGKVLGYMDGLLSDNDK